MAATVERQRREVEAIAKWIFETAHRQMLRRRTKLGKKITQWRKLQGQTVATASSASAMIASLSQQLEAANERIEELEGMNSFLEEELESFREHEDVVAAEEDDAFPCHIILNKTQGFRNGLSQLAQLVLLTATLPPRYQLDLFN